MPFATDGEESMKSPVRPVHKGEQVDWPQPPALNAYSFLSNEPMYTTPLETAGEDSKIACPVGPVHSGEQVLAPHPVAEKA